MDVKFKLLHPDAKAPIYATAGAACFDIHASIGEDVFVHPNCRKLVGTGLAFEVPEDHVMLIFSRSGHGAKHGVRLSNCVGVIDSDYRGELQIAVQNDGIERFTVSNGDRIAQAMILALPPSTLTMVTELSETERGTGGFGSTGS